MTFSLLAIFMNILCWNARGVASTKFITNMLDLICSQHLDIVFVCEPGISGVKASSIVRDP